MALSVFLTGTKKDGFRFKRNKLSDKDDLYGNFYTIVNILILEREKEKMWTYQMIIILNRNAKTRHLVGKLTVWLDISLKDVSEWDPVSRR